MENVVKNFEEIGFKPMLEQANWRGANRHGGNWRGENRCGANQHEKRLVMLLPVKVCVSSSLIVHQILVNARNVQNSANYCRTVFLSPMPIVQQSSRKHTRNW